MTIIDTFTGELNHFVGRCSKVDATEKSLGKVVISAARVVSLIATIAYSIFAAAAIFSGSAEGFFTCALTAVIFYDLYQVAKNVDKGYKSKQLFNNTIIFKPVVNFIDRVIGKIS